MSEAYIGEIRMFAGNFAPVGWALCDGSMLSISEHEALFTLIGTTYGGDGQTTFQLPDLRGRAPVHNSASFRGGYVLGEMGGAETVTLTSQQLPPHTHLVLAQTTPGTRNQPGGNVFAANSLGSYSTSSSSLAAMSSAALAPAGGSQPHDNMMPYQVIHFIIATEGLYPSSN